MNETWHEHPPSPSCRVYADRRKFSPEEVRKIRVAAGNGWSYYAIGKRVGVAGSAIRAIVMRRTYQDVE